jgi:NAD+ synthase
MKQVVERDILRGLNIDTELAELVLTQFLYQEITKAGFTRAVIGLSGGIDSALACFLAARALGPSNVYALRLPHRASSPDSLTDAQLVIDQLGVHQELVDITDAADALFAASPGITDLRRGNVMARLRMAVLYDRSAALDALVVGTSNKTEMLLGYGTIYGDLASAVNPVGDLYKTQVRQLSAYLDVPESIRTKPPTADLVPGQTDEGDLGFSYEEVDKLLYLIVDERFSIDELGAAGFESQFVSRVLSMKRRSQFKRTMPVIPKISGRSIGHDFRYLRDWGT